MTEPEPSFDKRQSARAAAIALESLELDLQAKQAQARKAQAEAAAALLPDLGSVAESTLTTTGEAVGSVGLTYAAVRAAARKVVERMPSMSTDQIVIVTSDTDLVGRIGTLRDVGATLTILERASDAALETHGTRDDATGVDQHDTLRLALAGFGPLGPGAAAASAVTGALPGLLSFLSARRTLDSKPATGDDLAATAEVVRAAGSADAPKGGRFIHDTFRLPPLSDLWDRGAALAVTRQRLATRQRELQATPDDEEAAAAATECASVAAAIDAFLTQVRTVPAGRNRSALAEAVLAEAFTADPRPFVLLVKANAGTTTQLTDNRPAFFDDRYFAAAWASITYLLIDTDDSEIGLSGVETGTASLTARLDGDVDFG